jgi:hypothetical protein
MTIRITAGPLEFIARLEEECAPLTCAAFRALLPFRTTLLQARWSGESAWIPLGDFQFDVPPENVTSTPAPGELLLHPRGESETEILFPYGLTRFASKFGPLAGNHFLTVVEGTERLAALGELVLRGGAQDITFAGLGSG